MDRQIILVSGAPGSGKTTLALDLYLRLNASLVSKDVLKEAIWDALEPRPGDLEWSRRAGAAAMESLWSLARFGRRIMLEANFRPHSEYERGRLRGLEAAIVEVYCWCPPEEATRRYGERARSSRHHPAHVTPDLSPELLAEFDQPVGLGPVIRVDTTAHVDVESIAHQVEACFAGLVRP